jgi:hypothetical protein
MNYYVIFPDGQKFGPADLNVLQTWVNEGRVTPDMDVEVVETGERMKAMVVTGLTFPAPAQPAAPADTINPYATPGASTGTPTGTENPYAQPAQPAGPGPDNQVYNPYQNPYPRTGGVAGGDGSSDITFSYIFSAIGLFASPCCSVCALPIYIGSFVFAKRATDKGNPGAKTAQTVAIVLLAISLIIVLATFGNFMAGVNSGMSR